MSNPSRFGRMPTPMKKTNVVPLPQVEKGGDVDLDLLSPFCRSDARCRVDCALHARAQGRVAMFGLSFACLLGGSVPRSPRCVCSRSRGGVERVRLITSQFPGPSGGRCRRSSERARACQASPFLFNFLFSLPPSSFPLFPSSLLAAFSLGPFRFFLFSCRTVGRRESTKLAADTLVGKWQRREAVEGCITGVEADSEGDRL